MKQDISFISNNNENMEGIHELEHLRKIFVGGLSPQTTEESLMLHFSDYGKVESVNIMHDSNTGRSRGFGFVVFEKSSMVDNVQDNRPHVIDDKTVQTKRVLPKTDKENVTVEKLFIGGIKDVHDEDDIREHFSKFGNILSINILTDKNTGKRRGFAYVEYDDYDAVDKAMLQKLHVLKNIAIDVKKSVYNQDQSRQQSSSQNYNVNDPSSAARKLFVGGLKNSHDEYSLRGYFMQFGQVVSINILTDKTTGKRRGFAYVEFSDVYGVENALSHPMHRIKNLLVDVKRSVYTPDQNRMPNNNITRMPVNPSVMVKKVFVGGLRNMHDEMCLRSHFSQFGMVTSVKIVVDKITGKRRGFAYVEFSDCDGVERAVAYPGHRLRNFLVEVKKSIYNQDNNADNYSQQTGGYYNERIGTGYDQSFSGGPTKHSFNVYRPMPYESLSNNNFGNGLYMKQGMIY